MKKQFKNILSIISIFMMASMLICPVNAQENNEKIQLNFWYAQGGLVEENTLRIIEEFNNSQDEIEVTGFYQGGYNDNQSALQAAAVSGDMPHISNIEVKSMQVFAENDLIVDLKPFIDAEEYDTDDFYPALLDNSRVGEGIYGFPFIRSTPIFYVNEDLIKETGLESPKIDWNWEEFTSYAEALTKLEQTTTGWIMQMDPFILEGLIRTAGGEFINEDETEAVFNQEPGVRLITWIKENKDAGNLEVLIGDSAGDSRDVGLANQTSGIIARSTAGLAEYLNVAEEAGFELSTKFLPHADQPASSVGGSQIVAIAKDHSEEEIKAAWEFIKFATNYENSILTSQNTGYLVTRQSAAKSDEMTKYYEENPQYETAILQLPHASLRPMHENYVEISDMVQEAFEKILVEDAPIQETLDEYAAEATKLLND